MKKPINPFKFGEVRSVLHTFLPYCIERPADDAAGYVT
jgi:hypothetical protein